MRVISSKVISYHLDKNVLFDKVDYGENILILYTNTTNHKQVFCNFQQQIAQENALLFYIAHKNNQLDLNGSSCKSQNFYFTALNEAVLHDLMDQLDKCFQEMEKKGRPLVLIADWLGVKVGNCELFLPFQESLVKKSQGITPSGWKRKYWQKSSYKTPFLLINAFETSELDPEFTHHLLELHHRAYLLQENLNTFLLPTISPAVGTIFPKFHVLPQETLEKLVKDNLELIALLLLEKSSKSGYQVLREIASHFHCLLSQGTLYPLLYQLEKGNKITKENGKGREVLYSLTLETRKQLQLKKGIALNAYQHLASFFGEGISGREKVKEN